jgi:glycosyltransferase involved in cell wall biosynthesis
VLITVAICTWNRARLLDRTLTGFRKLHVPPGIEWELLVVNNNCTDETDGVIDRHAGALPLRRLLELEPGHSMARNRAIAEASGDLIAWTDDDVIVDGGWLAAYAKAATDWPDAAYFGGPIDPHFEVEPPAWIAHNFEQLANAYAVLHLEGGTRPLGPREHVFGANMAFRASAMPRLAFDSRLGYRGSDKTGGDETDLHSRLRAAGRYGVWVDSARVEHLIPADRLTLHYLRECYRGRGRAMARIDGPPACALLLGYPRYAVRRYLQTRLSLARRWPGGRRWAEEITTAAFLEGFLAESIRQRRPGRRMAR